MNTQSIRILMAIGLFSSGAIHTAKAAVTLHNGTAWTNTWNIDVGQPIGNAVAETFRAVGVDIGVTPGTFEGVRIDYDAVNDILFFELTVTSGKFEWWEDGAVSPNIKMRLDANNKLSLFNSSGTETLSFSGSSGGIQALNVTTSGLSVGGIGAANITVGEFVSSASFIGPLTGNASTATALQDARDTRIRNLASMSLTKTRDPFGALVGISGATYNPRTGTLFCIQNTAGAGESYEVTQDGMLLRTIVQSNFTDTEAISYVTSFRNSGGTIFDVFLIAEENNEQRLSLCLLSSTATTLDRTATNGADPDNVSATTAYSGGNIANSGLEALTFDFTRGVCYYTIEKQTAAGSDNTQGTGNAKIFTRSITANSGSLAIGTQSELCNINALFAGGGPLNTFDISDMCYAPQDDTILVLSDLGDKVIKITRAGSLVETLATPGAQPEGVALNSDGTWLWVVGEDGAGAEFFRYELGFRSNLSNTANLNFGSTAGTAVADLTITVTGAVVGDVVALGVPNASITATSTFSAWVSAANTVTVRYSPKATENPLAGDFRATIIRE